MCRNLKILFLVVFLWSNVASVAAQPAAPGFPNPDDGFVLFHDPEQDRRILMVGLGMILGVVAYNYIVYSAAPMYPTVAGQLAAAQSAIAWAGVQVSAAYTALAGTVSGLAGAGSTAAATAIPVTGAVAPVVASTPALSAAPALAASAPAMGAAMTAVPAAIPAVASPIASGVSTGVVNLAHMLGAAAAVAGAAVAHTGYTLYGWLFGVPETTG